MTTLHQRLTEARAQLREAGVPDSEAVVDVGLFARTILGWDRARLITDATAEVPGALEPTFSQWIARRSRHEPTSYIVGVREFWGLEFAVSPAVLVPRPETEMVVEEVLRLAGPRAHIADVGTGSGCIGISVAHDAPDARIVATDISAEAVAVARENAARHGVATRMDFHVTSDLRGVDGEFYVIAANPPYVKVSDKGGLSPVVRYEPEVAIFGGPSGLRDLEGVLDTAAEKLRLHGHLVTEIGFGQEPDVELLVAARPALQIVHVRSDLQGLPRTLVIQKTAQSAGPSDPPSRMTA